MFTIGGFNSGPKVSDFFILFSMKHSSMRTSSFTEYKSKTPQELNNGLASKAQLCNLSECFLLFGLEFHLKNVNSKDFQENKQKKNDIYL